jgi:L-arabinose transport system substrate-binding protein
MKPAVRFLSFATLLGLSLLAGCSKSSDSANPTTASTTPARVKLGFLIKQPEEPWFQYEWKGADQAAKALGFDLIKLGVQDGEKVMTAIDSLAASGAGGFVICTPDVRLGPAIIARAKLKNLKVITVDDRFVDASGKFLNDVPYMGMSATAIGGDQGNALYAEMQKRGWTPANTAVCAVTFEELDTARERTDGSIAALMAAGFPADKIFKAPQKTTDIPGSFDAANILLTQHQGIKHWLLLGMNDTAVLGAVRAMEGRGFAAGDVIGIGINGTDCIDELRKPQPTGFFGSLLVSAPQEGYHTSEMLHAWIKDGTPPATDTRTVGQLITRANFEQVLRKEGIIE